MTHTVTDSNFKMFKNNLVNLTKTTTPSMSFNINYGVTNIKNNLYSFILENMLLEERKVTIPHYTNPLYINTDKISRNVFIFSGIIITHSIHNGRTYFVVRQAVTSFPEFMSNTDLKFVAEGEYDLTMDVGKPVIVLGHLFPKPLGKRDLTICACCEILKINDKILHNITETD